MEGICDLLRDVGLICSGIWTAGLGECMRDTLGNLLADQCRLRCSVITLKLLILILRVWCNSPVSLSWFSDFQISSGKFLEVKYELG